MQNLVENVLTAGGLAIYWALTVQGVSVNWTVLGICMLLLLSIGYLFTQLAGVRREKGTSYEYK